MNDLAFHARASRAAWSPSRSQRVPEVLRAAYAREESRLLAHPFLVRCEVGAVTPLELRRFLVQHGKYGSYFTRFLCALISSLPEGEQVLRLSSNLAEELGYGVPAGVPHAQLYAQMLQQFDIVLDAEPTHAQTQNLIDTMFMLCRQPGGACGLGALCLGAEALVPALYGRIVEGFAAHGVPASRLSFFQIHIECDDDHAETMFDILADWCRRSPALKEAALAAASTAVSARMRLLDSLLEPADVDEVSR